ncbi:preprotein translocase subunit SecG [Helicobacter sp. 11S03491-1]|nr:preprotein translocase subunit SecG [Helicobacter sp. 11S03491-1]
MINTLLVIQIILAILIVIVVLLQKSSSIGLGVYSGSNESVFGAKGPAGFMAKLTMLLGFLFLVNTISLGFIYNKEHNKSLLDNTSETSKKVLVPAAPLQNTLEPVKPLAPLAPQNQETKKEK